MIEIGYAKTFEGIAHVDKMTRPGVLDEKLMHQRSPSSSNTPNIYRQQRGNYRLAIARV